eukprot:380156-Pelagomonas_calceolata.AAC.1
MSGKQERFLTSEAYPQPTREWWTRIVCDVKNMLQIRCMFNSVVIGARNSELFISLHVLELMSGQSALI